MCIEDFRQKVQRVVTLSVGKYAEVLAQSAIEVTVPFTQHCMCTSAA